jgi:hypothetical protein
MTTFESIDEHFPWIVVIVTAIAEALLVIWFTTT